MELVGHHMCPDFQSLPTIKAKETLNESIIIIGAGMSGLSAAASLQRMGFSNLTILEASDNIGGRLKSTSFLEKDGGPPLDVGAEWIHSVKGAEVLRSIMNFQDEVQQDVVAPELINYKPSIFVNKIRSRMLTWLYKETKFKRTTWHQWLLDNFESVLPLVEVNSVVKCIDYNLDTVTIKLEDDSIRRATRAICTVPMQILKENVITFDPPLPKEMRNALDNMQMPPGLRVLFRMSKKFFDDCTYVGSLCGHRIDDLTLMYDPLWGKDDLPNDMHVLAYVAIGDINAGEMSELSNDNLTMAILAQIDKLYDGQGSKYLVGEPIVQNWKAEPYIRGAYTFPAPQKHRIQLSKPVGDDGKGKSFVFFAGEHTSLKHYSLVPGAACEGRRAALEVAASLSDFD